MNTTIGQPLQSRRAQDLLQCSLKPTPKRAFESSVSFRRGEIIITNSKFWANGTVILYYFYPDEDKASDINGESDMVRQGFKAWKDAGIGIDFKETEFINEAHIRIAFMRGEGTWSYIGRDCLGIPTEEPTMNFGWNLLTDTRTVGVAIHEIGHAIGFPHEHQNPNAGIVWNEAAVIEAFSKPPNSWDEATIRFNILDKLPRSSLTGSEWDPRSIMEYAFDAGLVRAPKPYDVEGIHPPGNRLSDTDTAWVRRFYPVLTSADFHTLRIGASEPIMLEDGEQTTYKFVPDTSRRYELRTFGLCDVVMVVFKQDDKNGREYRIGMDDSGKDDNAYIKLRLQKGSTYLVNVRMLYRNPDVVPAIMLW